MRRQPQLCPMPTPLTSQATLSKSPYLHCLHFSSPPGGLHHTPAGCDEGEGEFVGSLSSTGSDAILEDEYEMNCPGRQGQTLWELPCPARATDPARLPMGPLEVKWGVGQTPLLVALRSLARFVHVMSSPIHSFIPLLIHPLTHNY